MYVKLRQKLLTDQKLDDHSNQLTDIALSTRREAWHKQRRGEPTEDLVMDKNQQSKQRASQCCRGNMGVAMVTYY